MDSHSKFQDALLEIGTEEIPSSYMPPALAHLKSYAESWLSGKRLPFRSVQVYGTPRRLALLISGLAQKSEMITSEVLGPRLSAAKGPDGQWTQAALGFARSQGISPSDLKIKSSPKGEVLCAAKAIEGVKAEKLLAALFAEIVPSIPFPKRMVWNGTGFKFARPIRNLMALCGGKTLRISVAGVKSSNKTFTLSHTSSKRISISSPQAYLPALKNHCVLADPEPRKLLILNSASQLAKRIKGNLKSDEDLLEEVTWLVEHPVGILGGFDAGFLELPSEVLITVMKKHQKFFSIVDGSGKLMPFFVGIRNGISEHQEIVKKGYEKVLLARLFDAKFFFDEDLKKSLEFYADQASKIMVHEKLGDVSGKLARMALLADKVLELLKDPSINAGAVKRAIQLAKFDLTTKMVYEYPELQGVMGEIYSRHWGESPLVAEAVREHYAPVNSAGPVPKNAESKIAALCEKLDGLAGNFWVGYEPSGNADPYGLRRQSSGILRILMDAKWDLPLRELVEAALNPIAARGNGSMDRRKLLDSILLFLTDRFQLLMRDAGFELDEIYSVTRNSSDPDLGSFRIHSLKEKIEALHEVRGHPDFDAVAGAYKRAGNILKQARQKGMEVSHSGFDVSLLKDPAEKNLHALMDELSRKTLPMVEQKQYKAALQNWVLVRKDLDRFFEEVMVMAPDELVRNNRLSLLSLLEAQFRQLADFSLIQNRGGLA